MIEIRINKEIGNFEPKFVGPFTIRQTISVGLAAPICYFIFKFASPIITPDLAGFLCAIPAAAAAAFGWIKPYGMRMEKFIQSVFINRVMAPANRRYKTKNHHESILAALQRDQDAREQAAATPQKKVKQHLNQTKSKYKPSPEALR